MNSPESSLENLDFSLGNAETFMAELAERAETTSPEEMVRLLKTLERYAQTPDRTTEIYTDPDLKEFICMQVPARHITKEGKIEDDPQKKIYIIGVPFIFIAGGAPLPFFRGEILHEQGHAEATDFERIGRFETLARQEGYDPTELKLLNDRIEDPRNERLKGGPLNPYEQSQLFAKNRQYVIPSIAAGFTNRKFSPTDQFKFLIKLERIWALHAKELEGIEKPWGSEHIHPRVQEEYARIEHIISKIAGDSVRPAMKVNPEVEQLIVEHIWPALKRLIDEFPHGGHNSSTGKKGGPSVEDAPKEAPHLNSNDPSSWPLELQRFLQKMERKHEKRWQEKARQTREDTESNDRDLQELEDRKHHLEKLQDGFEDAKFRERYSELKEEVFPVIQRLKRIITRYLSKNDEPPYEWGKRGVRFNTRRYVSRILTGLEEPMGRRQNPEKIMFVLQIVIDISTSMYQPIERIENAIKASIALMEAVQDHNIMVEVLVSDQKNVSHDPQKYCVKAFNERFFGPEKSRLVSILDNRGGSNEDADSIRAALPRLQKAVRRARPYADRVGSLVIFITDSTSKSQDTKNAADEARKITPFEGIAITPEDIIVERVKEHFGSHSIISPSLEEFPEAIERILERHMVRYRSS